MGGPSSWHPSRMERLGHRHTLKEDCGGCSQETAVCKAGSEASEATIPADTLIWFQPPDCETITMFKPPSLWYFAIAALAD